MKNCYKLKSFIDFILILFLLYYNYIIIKKIFYHIFLLFVDYLMKRIFLKGGNALGNVKRAADEMLSAACRDYKGCLEKYCRVRLGEAADSVDDCVQETFYIYYKKLLNGETIEKPKAFLYRTADNMIKRKLSEHYKDASHTVSLDEARDKEAVTSDETASLLDYDKLKDTLLSVLTEKEQYLYRLKYEQRKSLKEIGEILNIPPATVANRTSRLRSKIKGLVGSVIEDSLKEGG